MLKVDSVGCQRAAMDAGEAKTGQRCRTDGGGVKCEAWEGHKVTSEQC